MGTNDGSRRVAVAKERPEHADAALAETSVTVGVCWLASFTAFLKVCAERVEPTLWPLYMVNSCP